MGCKIVFSPQAIADLEEVVRYIARNDLDAAQRIGNNLIERVAILENFPLVGSAFSKQPGIRKLVSRPYIIFYRHRPESESVDILRYWHGSRSDPDLRSSG